MHRPFIAFLALSAAVALVAPCARSAEQLPGNTLLVATDSGIVEIDPSGATKGVFAPGVSKRIAIAADGTVLSSNDADVVVIDASGSVVGTVTEAVAALHLLGVGFDSDVLFFDASNDDLDRARPGSTPQILVNAGLVNVVDAELGPDGLLYASDTAVGKVFVVSPAGELLRSIAAVQNGIRVAFDAAGTLLVLDPTNDRIRRIDARTGVKGDDLIPELTNEDMSGLAPGPDGFTWVADKTTKSVVALDADGAVVRTIGVVVNGVPTAPNDIAFVPFRFKTKLKAHTEQFEPPSDPVLVRPTIEINKGNAVISIFPGSAAVFVDFDAVPEHVGDVLGANGFAFCGRTASTNPADKSREFAGLQSFGFDSRIRFAALSLAVKGKIDSTTGFFAPRKIAGEMHVGDSAVLSRVVLSGKKPSNP